MNDMDPRLRHLLLLMGVSSAVGTAFTVAAQQRGWPELDRARTKQTFAVIGPLMLSGLPEREVVEQLEEPYPALYLNALAFCQADQLDGEGYSKGATRLPAWALGQLYGRLPVLPKDRDFLELIERYFGTEELKQMVAQMSKR